MTIEMFSKFEINCPMLMVLLMNLNVSCPKAMFLTTTFDLTDNVSQSNMDNKNPRLRLSFDNYSLSLLLKNRHKL